MSLLSRSFFVFALCAACLCFALNPNRLQAAIWVNTAGGSWNTATNWDTNPLIPNAIDAIADFSTLDITADATVTLDGSFTIGSLLFGDASPSNNWIINPGTPGSSTLTLSVTSGSPTINVANPTAIPIFPGFVAQSATINAAIAGTQGLTKTGLGTLVLTAANTYSGATLVKAGGLTLDYSVAGAPASNIVPSGSALTLGSGPTTGTAGALNILGANGATNSQAFSATAVDFGSNVISVNQNGATTVNVSLGTLSQANHGGLNLTLPTAGTISAANASIPNLNGIIGGWATVGTGASASWASNDGSGNIVPYSSFTTVAAAGTIVNGATTNISFTGGNISAPAGTTDVNSVYTADAANRTLTVASGSTLRLGAKGGIFKSDNTGNFALTVGAAGSILTAGGAANTAGELILNANALTPDLNGMVVASAINDNGTGAVTLVKTGNAALQLNVANGYTGGTYINSGRARANATGGFGSGQIYVATGAQAYLNAGTFGNTFNLSGKSFYEGSPAFTSGAIRLAGTSVVISGTINLTGDARIGSRGAQATTGTGATISGQITGNFALELNRETQQGTAGLTSNMPTITLSNTTNNWGGNTTIGRGRIRVGGTGEVIPDGPGKGNVIIFGEQGSESILTLDSHTETINGLLAAGDTSLAVVTNSTTGQGTLKVGNNDATSNYAGRIADSTGTVALTKIGAGTLTLSGANTYSGPTAVQNGSLVLANAAALPTGISLTLGNSTTSGTLDLAGNAISVGSLATSGTGNSNTIGNSSNSSAATVTVTGGSTTFGGKIQDTLPGGNQTVALTMSGGTLTLSGSNTYTGATTIGGGTLSVTGSLASTGSVALNSGGTLAGNGDGTTTGKIGNLTMAGGANLHPGATSADGSIGTIKLNSLTVNGGDFRYDLSTPANSDRINVTNVANFVGGSTITLASAPGAGNYTLLTAGSPLTGTAPTLNTPPAGTTRASYAYHFGDGVSGANNITLAVTGSPLTLNWTGSGTPNNVWDLNTTQNWANANPPGEVQKFFNLDTVNFGDAGPNHNITISGSITPAAVTVNNSSGNDYTFSGSAIGDSSLGGGTSLTKAGAGTLTLNNSNSYLGLTAVQNGRLVLGTGGALPNGTSLSLGDSSNHSGVVDLKDTSITISGLSTVGIGAGNIISSSGTISASTITVTGGTNSFAGVIKDTLTGGTQTVGLTLSAGSLTLTGDNTYTGQTFVSSGATLQVGNGGTTGSLGATSLSVDGTLAINRSDAVLLSGAIAGGGSLQHLGSGTVTLTGSNSYGPTLIGSGATLQIGNGGTSGTLGNGDVSNGGTLVFNRSDGDTANPVVVGNNISGTGGVQQIGAGTTRLSGTNSYNGPVTISAGTLQAGSATALGAASGQALINGGTLDVNGQNLGAKVLNIQGAGANGVGAIINTGANQINAVQNVVLTGDATIGGTGRWDIRGGVASLSTAGGQSYNLTKIGTNQFSIVAGNVSALVGNIDVLGGVFAYQTTTNGLGDPTKTLTIGPSGALNFFNSANPLNKKVVSNGGRIWTESQTNNTIGLAVSPQPVTLNSTTTFDNNANTALTVNSAIGGVGGLTKINPGTTTLKGINTYQGDTTVNGGLLQSGAADQFNHASNLILGGGNYNAAGFSETMSKVRLNASSTIDFGTSALNTTLTFAASSDLSSAWGTTNVLTITDWDFTSQTNHMFVGTNSQSLTRNQLNDIVFSGASDPHAVLTSSGELVPGTPLPALKRGDLTGDGVIDLADLATLEQALVNSPAYEAGYPTGALSDAELLDVADINNDGAVNNADLQPEISALITGVAPGPAPTAAAPVPEPASWLLLAFGSMWLIARRWQGRRTANYPLNFCGSVYE